MSSANRPSGGVWARSVIATRMPKALMAAVLSGVLVVSGLWAEASAQTSDDPSPTPITDYANYPLGLGIIPDTCTAGEAAEVVIGARFSADGGPEVPDLRQLNLTSAQQVTMRWDGFAPGCEGIGVALSGKLSGSTEFDPSIDQIGDRTAYCGPEAGMIPCTAPYELTLFLDDRPGDPVPPCFQVDASLGPPLAVVGPSGSFYGILNGQFNMLISAWNGGREPCGVPVTVTTAAPPPTVPPPTTPPPTTPPPSVSPSSVSITSTSLSGASVSVGGISATIPRTGASSAGASSALGVVLILLGSALVVGAAAITRRLRHL